MVNELAGRVAIVTGGASGFGSGLVEKFAREGARVLIADVDEESGEKLAAALGPDSCFRRTDVSDPGQLAALVAAAIERFGALDVMVNSAALPSETRQGLLDDDLEDFHRVMAVNLLGVMAGTRDAARRMAAAGGGSIINVVAVGEGDPATYRACKAAVVQFTRSAAIELAPHKVRVNAIAPGGISPLPLTPSGGQEAAADVAEAALYLAGERSRYVTGTVLPLGG